MDKLSYIAFIFKNYRSEGYYVCYRCLNVPNRSLIKEKKIGGTIMGPQWYRLGTPAPISYHSVLFFNEPLLLIPYICQFYVTV